MKSGSAGAWQEHSGLARILIYLAFAAYVFATYTGTYGDDLASSFVACRLIAAGQIAQIYDFDPAVFSVVHSTNWTAAAQAGGYDGVLHPYVQIPLWAWSLQPLCIPLGFFAFKLVFLALAILCVIALIELTIRFWAPKFAHPALLAAVLVVSMITIPLPFTFSLVQTHPLVLLLTALGALAAERGRPASAGAAMALAAAIKITPGLFLVYWLIRGQYRAAGSFVGFAVVLGLATWAAVGPAVLLDFLHTIRRVSNTLVLAYYNQSIVTWLAQVPDAYQQFLNDHALPLALAPKLAANLLAIGSAIGAGWIMRNRPDRGEGTVALMLAMTIFAPVAWIHYYILLIPALMILIDRGGRLPVLLALVVMVLNLEPFTVSPVHLRVYPLTVPRAQLLCGLLTLAALLATMLRGRTAVQARDHRPVTAP